MCGTGVMGALTQNPPILTQEKSTTDRTSKVNGRNWIQIYDDCEHALDSAMASLWKSMKKAGCIFLKMALYAGSGACAGAIVGGCIAGPFGAGVGAAVGAALGFAGGALWEVYKYKNSAD